MLHQNYAEIGFAKRSSPKIVLPTQLIQVDSTALATLPNTCLRFSQSAMLHRARTEDACTVHPLQTSFSQVLLDTTDLLFSRK